MRKRPRRKRPKRSSRGQESQRRQKLSRQIRELYPSFENAAEFDWHVDLEAHLEQTPRRPRGPSRHLQAAGSRPAANHRSVAENLPEAQRQGRIVNLSSGACRVESDGEEVDCILPSDLARDQQAAVAVGDEVVFSTHGEHAHRLCRVLPRRTTLSRPDPRNHRRQRVIAANIDIAVHVASVVEPPLRPALIDRYLIAIERGGAAAAICVNKIDLLPTAEARREVMDRLRGYAHLAGAILPCSAVTGEGLERLRGLLAGRTAVLVGHSGVGKSSLLNALDPDLGAGIGQVSVALGKGRHTTTRSNLYRLAGDIRIVDTPGIRELGLWQLEAPELDTYFPEFAPLARQCRFSDCRHSHEPACAVRAAAETDEHLLARYQTYRRILSSLDCGDLE